MRSSFLVMLGASAEFAKGDDVIRSTQHARRRNFRCSDVVGAVLALVLVAVAFVVPYMGNETITPIINRSAQTVKDFADAAPLFGFRDVHVGWGTPFAVLIAIAMVLWGPSLAQSLSWRRLAVGTYLIGAAWAMSLAMVDGWQRGFVDRLTSRDEYLHEVPAITDIPSMLHGFTQRILDYQPDSWTTHVAGHPPGAVLTFVWLDRIGLSGGAWASALCVAVGSSAAVAVIVTVRALGDEAMARRAAPFLALAPAVIWIAASADAVFTGVVAWGIALLALSASRSVRYPWVAALGAGVLLGFGVYLSYGLVLMGVLALAVLLVARNARPLLGAVIGALAVAAIFTAYGFWWFDGYTLVQERYYQGIAADRPFAYWGWANFAALVCAVGVAVPAAVPRAFSWSRLRSLSPIPVLVVAALVIVVIADLSRLSKAETERIWLPFAVWLLTAPALLPKGSHRFWLAAQAVGALAINHLLFTNW